QRRIIYWHPDDKRLLFLSCFLRPLNRFFDCCSSRNYTLLVLRNRNPRAGGDPSEQFFVKGFNGRHGGLLFWPKNTSTQKLEQLDGPTSNTENALLAGQ